MFSTIEKPIDKIRYPSCTKKARHYLVLAQIAIVVWFVLFAVLQYIAVRYFDGSRIILINEEEDYSDNIADLVFTGRPRDILPKIEN